MRPPDSPLPPPSAPRPPGEASPEQPPARTTVWLADDSAPEAAHARGLLGRVADSVETFADGASVLERLAVPGGALPDLLVLDWNMPGVSGLDTLRSLRERFSPTELPVLVLTASSHDGALEEAFGAGANDYVAKPARAVELLWRVRTLLQTRRDAEALRLREREHARVRGEAEAARADAEAARAEAEAARLRLATLFESAPAIICAFRGPELVYEVSNPLHQRLVGVDRQLVGRPVREAVPEAVDQGIVALLEGVYRTGEPYVARELLLRLDRQGDGTLTDAFVNVVYQAARDAAGNVVGVDVFGFEVTEQVLARQRVEALAAQLGTSEERQRRVVEATGTGIWEMDTATETLVADAHFRELFGLAPDEPFPLEKGLSIIHAEDRPRVAQAVADALAGKHGGRYREEYRTVRTLEGRWRWVEARGQAVFGPDGTPTHLLGTGVDITARKEAEGAREALLDALAAQPLFGVVLFHGPRWVFERANQKYRQMVGGRDVVGRPLLEALPELVGQGFDTLLQEVRRTGVPTILRETPAQVDRSGTGVLEDGYFDVVFQPVCSPGGACEDVLHVVHDVTDRVKLRQEADRLMALEKERASFEKQLIGIVSHDLRNPISAIQMGATTLLRRPDIEERQRRTVERILTSAGRAKRLIHDLLDFTQARLRGGLDAVTTQGDFHAVVRQVLEETQIANPQRPLHLTQTGEGAGTFDADRVEQLVGNLLSNALHYSPVDSPVHVETRGEADALVLTVHNGGAPIPPELMPRLFQPMQRGVDEGGVSEVRSVGLGLYIVDHVVRAHGGSVQVASTVDAGTTFTVRLPRA